MGGRTANSMICTPPHIVPPRVGFGRRDIAMVESVSRTRLGAPSLQRRPTTGGLGCGRKLERGLALSSGRGH